MAVKVQGPTPGNLPDPGIELASLVFPAFLWRANSLALAPPGKPLNPWATREFPEHTPLC